MAEVSGAEKYSYTLKKIFSFVLELSSFKKELNAFQHDAKSEKTSFELCVSMSRNQ